MTDTPDRPLPHSLSGRVAAYEILLDRRRGEQVAAHGRLDIARLRGSFNVPQCTAEGREIRGHLNSEVVQNRSVRRGAGPTDD